MNFKKDDKVRIKDTCLEGIISHFYNKDIVEVTVDGRHYSTPISFLIKIHSTNTCPKQTLQTITLTKKDSQYYDSLHDFYLYLKETNRF